MIVGNSIPACLPRILVPADEAPALIRFAARVAKMNNAALLSLYVQPRPEAHGNPRRANFSATSSLANDLIAQEAFRSTRAICTDAGVPVLQIYAIHNCLGEMLLDHAATWGVDAVVMGGARKKAKPLAESDPVLQKVYALLPPTIPLIIHG